MTDSLKRIREIIKSYVQSLNALCNSKLVTALYHINVILIRNTSVRKLTLAVVLY